MSQWTSQEARSPGSLGCAMYLALDFGEQSTLLESPGRGITTWKCSLLFSPSYFRIPRIII